MQKYFDIKASLTLHSIVFILQWVLFRAFLKAYLSDDYDGWIVLGMIWTGFFSIYQAAQVYRYVKKYKMERSKVE